MGRRPVDLRSDTVTRPGPEMLAAMTSAPLGDDVFEDDPTIVRLERVAAARLGKEAGLFVPSGTMGNQTSIMTHTRRGDEVICVRPSHIQSNEVGAAAVVSGVTLAPLDAPTGELDAARVAAAIQDDDVHHARTGLVCLEYAHCSGAVPPLSALSSVSALCQERGIPLHLDGARIFNAAHALGVDAAEIAQHGDSVMCCLSKGLGAPIGSLVLGTQVFIDRARRARKLLGGGMRQVGLLGAAGLYALEHHVDRLADDHQRAARLAAALAELPGVRVREAQRDINMVWFEYAGPREAATVVSELRERGVVILPPLGEGLWRVVTHLDVDDDDLEHLMQTFGAVLGG